MQQKAADKKELVRSRVESLKSVGGKISHLRFDCRTEQNVSRQLNEKDRQDSQVFKEQQRLKNIAREQRKASKGEAKRDTKSKQKYTEVKASHVKEKKQYEKPQSPPKNGEDMGELTQLKNAGVINAEVDEEGILNTGNLDFTELEEAEVKEAIISPVEHPKINLFESKVPSLVASQFSETNRLQISITHPFEGKPQNEKSEARQSIDERESHFRLLEEQIAELRNKITNLERNPRALVSPVEAQSLVRVEMPSYGQKEVNTAHQGKNNFQSVIAIDIPKNERIIDLPKIKQKLGFAQQVFSYQINNEQKLEEPEQVGANSLQKEEEKRNQLKNELVQLEEAVRLLKIEKSNLERSIEPVESCEKQQPHLASPPSNQFLPIQSDSPLPNPHLIRKENFGKIRKNTSLKKDNQDSSVEYIVINRQMKKISGQYAVSSANISQIEVAQLKPQIAENMEIKEQKSVTHTNSFQETAMPVPLPRGNNRSKPPRFIIERGRTPSSGRTVEVKRATERNRKLIGKFEQNESNFKNFVKKSQANAVRSEDHQEAVQKVEEKLAKNPESDIQRKIYQLEHPSAQGNALFLKGVVAKKTEVEEQTQFVSKQPRPSTSKQVTNFKMELGNDSPTNVGKKLFEFQFQTRSQKKPLEVESEEGLPDIQFPPELKFTETKFPEIITGPKPNTTLEEMMQLILKVCDQFEVKVESNELHSLILKRYKNCISFTLPNSSTKVIWHFSGKFYLGDWNEEKAQKNGEGIEIDPAKYLYRGQFLNGKKHGSGIFVQTNGNIYEGQWAEGEKNGHGKSFDFKTKVSYQGEWKNGKKNGSGILRISDKEFYQGMLVQNLRHGHGLQIFANGDRYQGEYALNKFNGKGRYNWADGSYYEGKFLDGSRNGFGKWKSSNNTKESYVGEYVKDKKHGNGRYVWGNGCVYEGQFMEDVKHGQGQVHYPDGREMVGVWTKGILTDIVSKIKETHKEEPLEMKTSNQVTTRITIIQSPSQNTQLPSNFKSF